jgi:hypothetical protein
MFKPQSTFCLNEKRDAGLMKRINDYARHENLPPSIALKRFLSMTLPTYSESEDRCNNGKTA